MCTYILKQQQKLDLMAYGLIGGHMTLTDEWLASGSQRRYSSKRTVEKGKKLKFFSIFATF
jgi:hypothetical protein